MAEFHTSREKLTQASASLDEARRKLFTAREALLRAQRERAALERRPGDQGRAFDAIDHRIAELERTVKALEKSHSAAGSALEKNLGDFAIFLDPTKNIERLDDHYPILLFPVRIETRFKTVEGNDELWVRIYPDEISVSSFEGNLTEEEWRNTRAYWAQRWAAGGDEGEHRAAWKALVGSSGSGRARWLIDQVEPVNIGEEPKRALGESLLVVVSTDPLADDDKTAMAPYWQALAEAPGDTVAAAQAFDALAALRGDARASEIAATFRPYNLDAVSKAKPGAGTTRTVFVQFPAAESLDLQEQAWRHAARARTLPDQFVIMGFENGAQTLFEVGKPVPPELQVGPDPSAPEHEQIRADNADLAVPGGLKWMTDFDAAVANGMGFKVALNPIQARRGFDQLIVLGVRMGFDPMTGASQLEALLSDHLRSRKGCTILAQGTPTNNVEEGDSGYSWRENSDVSFDHYFKQDPNEDPDDWRNRKDGRRLADALGIATDVLKQCPNYFATDQAEARAMNEALWPATLGYFMDEMVDTVFSDPDIEWTRDHFTKRIVGTGTLPAIRIGKQPYGVLAAAPFSRLHWFDAEDRLATMRSGGDAARLRRLYETLKIADRTWSNLAGERNPMGAPVDDPYQALTDALGLHSGSVEYYQRFAETAEQLFNRMKLSGLAGGFIAALIAAGYVESGMNLLSALGHQAQDDEVPEILNKLFLKEPNLLKGPVIDDAPLSELNGIRAYLADGSNYLDWLIAAARQSHDALRRQSGFLNDTAPDALLYLMLHHALDLSFVETAVRLHVEAGLIQPELARSCRAVPKFFQVAEPSGKSESPWTYLYKVEPRITGNAVTDVGRFIAQTVMTGNSYLSTQLNALERLAHLPTARLERAFADHVDCCSYRLDAWWMSLLDAQLEHMRSSPNLAGANVAAVDVDGQRARTSRGLYLGAYGWVENLRPEHKALTPVELPQTLEAIFNRPGEPTLQHDPTNQGLIHAPSLDHATTAAILRNGHLSHRSSLQPDALAINLTSSRVRDALSIIEGIRNGQSLSSLLGYRFERGLHDVEGLFLDSIILDLRRQFPLRANKLQSTKVDDADVDIGLIEARNVIDGLSLVRHVEKQTGGSRLYPFGLADKLPALDATRSSAIDAQVASLIDVNDAVADLAMAEGVHQLVKGNLERAAANFDSYSKGHFPPIPDVVQTPPNGVMLTHRVALHLETGLDPDDPANITPRSKGEPAINRWLGVSLPPLADIICEIDWFDHSSASTKTETVSMDDLGLAPIDLLFMARDSTGQEMQALDQELVHFLADLRAPRPDAPIKIRYHVKKAGKFSLFEVAPLLRDFEALLIASRPLRATDVVLPKEGSKAQDLSETIDDRKIDRVRTALVTERGTLDGFVTTIEGDIKAAPDDDALITLALDNVDDWIDQFVPIAHRISRFGIAEASFAFALDRKAAEYASLVGRIDALHDAWLNRLAQFDSEMTDYAGGLPISDEEKTAFLLKAALLLTPAVIVPPTTDPDDLRDLLVATHRPVLAAAIAALPGLLPAGNKVGRLCKDVEAFNSTVIKVDPDPVDLKANRSALSSLMGSLAAKARALIDDVDKRVAAADALVIEAASATPAKSIDRLSQAIQQLTSSDFRILPEFNLSGEVAAEWQAAQADSAQLLTYLETDKKVPYPVEDWLHGAARVREKLAHLERAGQIQEAFGVAELQLTPLQFPYRPDDRWLALEFPEFKADGTTPFTVDEDKLLYTALFGTGVAATASRQCGLLCEEWSEVLPSLSQVTGVTFHYDRPNCEAPQSLILALPAQIDGHWAWEDVVDTLQETLAMAKKRAVEPSQLARTSYGAFLPAIIASVSVYPVFQQVNFAINNSLVAAVEAVQP